MDSYADCCQTVKTARSGALKLGPRLMGHDRPTIERPQCEPSRFSMKPSRLLTAISLLIAASSPGFAADTVFPPGVRVGMTPLVGLSPARTFAGFETGDEGVKVVVGELPAEAYGEVM